MISTKQLAALFTVDELQVMADCATDARLWQELPAHCRSCYANSLRYTEAIERVRQAQAQGVSLSKQLALDIQEDFARATEWLTEDQKEAVVTVFDRLSKKADNLEDRLLYSGVALEVAVANRPIDALY